MILITPIGMDLKSWADRSMNIFQKFGFRERLMDDDWKKWGMRLYFVLTRVRGGAIPRPDAFEDWREWAVRLNRVIADG